MTPESLISKTLAPDLVPGWLPTWEDHAPIRGAAGTSSLGNEFAGLAIEANQANPEILGECRKGHS